jgi:predicted histidine transporter YuiF (NhaC family)
MFKMLVIDILKSGSMAFFFSKITKAIGQKEISEIIAGSGWALVAMDTFAIIVPGIKTVIDSIDKVEKLVISITQFFQNAEKLFGR